MFPTYSSALAWLYARNQFSVKLGLENPRRLMRALGNPEQGLRILHVAGTNGKGSVCANLAALLRAAGVPRVGLYTSPHLVSFRERIRIDGEPIPRSAVTGWLNDSLPLLGELNPTYFECVTAMALSWFRERDCGAVVLETGLGGRLDATNVVSPLVTVITSISLDHMDVLGGTLEAIWGEKLGIVKPGVPLIVDESRPELARLAGATARAAGAPFLNAADRLERRGSSRILKGRFRDYALPADLREEEHQMRNAALSVLGFEAFLGREAPPEELWMPALRGARMPGRTQWLTPRSPRHLPVLLDGAHNAAGVEALRVHLARSRGGRRARVLFSLMADKDLPSIHGTLRAISDDLVFLDLSSRFARALREPDLRAALGAAASGLRGASASWEDLEPLLRRGDGRADPEYAVFCGSLYLLGEVIPLLMPHYQGLEEFRDLAGEG